MKTGKLIRVTWLLSATVLLCLFVSCTSAIVPKESVAAGQAGQRMTIPADLAGMCHAGMPGSAQENAVLDELGITWVRNDINWHEVEKAEGEWDFSYYDRFVAANNARGRKMLFVLGFDTPWIHKEGKRKPYISPEELPKYLNYVEKVVTRYKGKVEAWEIWNEPNMNVRFWKGPAKDFYALSKAAALKIRECDPDAKIIAGSFFMVPSGFIKNMFASGALDDVDAISFHPYSGNPGGVAYLYDKFTALMKKMDYTGDIWVTEIGYPTAGISPNRISEKNLGAYIADTYTALALRGARVIVWYHLKDDHTKDTIPASLDSERFFGLVYRDYEKKTGIPSFKDIRP
jgi:hypothetical protein